MADAEVQIFGSDRAKMLQHLKLAAAEELLQRKFARDE
jgi:hypothetical protein